MYAKRLLMLSREFLRFAPLVNEQLACVVLTLAMILVINFVPPLFRWNFSSTVPCNFSLIMLVLVYDISCPAERINQFTLISLLCVVLHIQCVPVVLNGSCG